MAAKVEDYVEAARAVGNPHWRIALRHILPNVVPPLLVQASLAIAGAIIAESALSFLGLGQQPPSPSWGSMLNSAQRFITNAPWMAFWPGVAIFFAVLSFNLWATACATRWIRVASSRQVRLVRLARLDIVEQRHGVAEHLGLLLDVEPQDFQEMDQFAVVQPLGLDDLLAERVPDAEQGGGFLLAG